MEASQFICYSVSQLQRRKPILYVTCQICAQESSQSLSHSFLPSDFQKLWKYLKNLTRLYFLQRIFLFSFCRIPFIPSFKTYLRSKFGIRSCSVLSKVIDKCPTDWLTSSVIIIQTATHTPRPFQCTSGPNGPPCHSFCYSNLSPPSLPPPSCLPAALSSLFNCFGSNLFCLSPLTKKME